MPPERRSKRTASNPVATQPYTRTSSNSRIVSSSSSASVAARPANGKTTSLRLTVKAPPSKLRQATSGSTIPPNPYADTPSESDTTPAPPRRAARATRNPRAVVDPDSDELDDEQELEEDDAEGEVDQDLDSEEDAEGEDEDVDMDDHPPPPVITQRDVPGKAKPHVTVTAPKGGALKSVEAKEMEDDDDEELSELESGDEDELGGNGEDEEDELDDDSDEDDDNSRSATPDLSKLTKRQRGGLVEFEGAESGDLMALSNEALKKKHFTEEEHVQRRAEMARRRKNLSDKRNEEEKVCFSLLAVNNTLLTFDSRWTRLTSFSTNKLPSAAHEPKWKPLAQSKPAKHLLLNATQTLWIPRESDGSAIRLAVSSSCRRCGKTHLLENHLGCHPRGVVTWLWKSPRNLRKMLDPQ